MASEADSAPFNITFNRAVKIEGKDDLLSANGGFLILREMDHRLGVMERLASGLWDPRHPVLRRYELVELLRERVFAMAHGYAHQDDLDALAHDPAMRAAAWNQPGEKVAAERMGSQPTQSRLMTLLSYQRRDLDQAMFDCVRSHFRASNGDRRTSHGTVDMDGFPIEVHGEQEGAAYNGYYKAKVYYPLLATFSVNGDFDHAKLGNGFIGAELRTGDAAGAEGARWFAIDCAKRAGELAQHVDIRMDAAFTIPDVMDGLQENGVHFLGRLRNNARLDALALPHLKRPSGRPSADGREAIIEMGPYQIDTWEHAYRLVLVIVDRPDERTGQLKIAPDYFWLITNWSEAAKPGCALLEHYRQRGTAEDRFGEINNVLKLHLSHRDFAKNEAMLYLALLAFNFANILRGELERATGSGWDLGRVVQTVQKVPVRMVSMSHRIVFYIGAAFAPILALVQSAFDRWTMAAPQPPLPRQIVQPPEHAHLSLVLRL